MIPITTFLNKYWTLLVIVGMALYIVISGNINPNTDKTNDRIDSILQVLTIPEKAGEFNNQTPQPTIIVVPQPGNNGSGISDEMLRAFAEMKDDNAKTRAYAEAIALKVYNNKYQDSIVEIIVKDSVEGGKLTNQDVKWKVKEQKAKYYENIYYMKPQFTISAGLKFQTAIDTAGFSNEKIYPTIGFKGRKGWKFEGGINLLNTKEYMIGIEKDIFTKYNKIEEKKQF